MIEAPVLVLITGLWVNPANIVYMKDNKLGCHIRFGYGTYQTSKKPCNEVKQMIEYAYEEARKAAQRR
jgi:hypothetical protein|tara:strand:- start:251 stop:454 length:204 start_codon:yes stop_codon:yes gene_type:complete